MAKESEKIEDIQKQIDQIKIDLSAIKTEYHTERTWLFRYFYLFLGAAALIFAIIYGTATAEIGRKISETLSSTAIQQSTDSAQALLSSISLSKSESDRILDILKSHVPMSIVTGSTSPDNTPWETYVDGLKLRVNTESYHFTTTPQYYTVLKGESSHWSVIGTTSIYEAGPTGFTIFLKPYETKKNENKIDLKIVKQYKWHIQWVAFLSQ